MRSCGKDTIVEMGEVLSYFFVAPGMIHGGQDWTKMCETLEEAKTMNISGAHEAWEDSTCEWNEFLGFLTLVAHMFVYGYVLYVSAELIGEGSELLLLIPSMRGLVGSVILPVMGAVPDGIMVLFSGLGDNAQEELRVGMGALAGSTVMLLTVPWFLAILGGRVDVGQDEKCLYSLHYVMYKGERKKRKLGNARGSLALFKSAVEAKPVIRKSGWIMAATSISYLVIEIPSFALSAADTKEIDRKDQSSFVEPFAVIGVIVSITSFFAYLAYCFYQSRNSNMDDTAVEIVASQKMDDIMNQSVREGKIDVVTCFLAELERTENRIIASGHELSELRDFSGLSPRTPIVTPSSAREDESAASHLFRRIKLFVYE